MRTVDDPLDPQVFGRDWGTRDQKKMSAIYGKEASGSRNKRWRGRFTILEQVEPGFQGVARTDGLVASTSEEEDGTLDLLKHLIGREWPFKPEHELLQLEHVLAESLCRSESRRFSTRSAFAKAARVYSFRFTVEVTHALLAIARESFVAGPGEALSAKRSSRLRQNNGGESMSLEPRFPVWRERLLADNGECSLGNLACPRSISVLVLCAERHPLVRQSFCEFRRTIGGLGTVAVSNRIHSKR